jgi:hypothetical protein
MLPGLLLLLLLILQLPSAVVDTCNYCCILVEIHQVSQVAHTVLLLLLLLLLPPLLHHRHVLLALALGIPEPFAPFYNSSCHHASLSLSLSLSLADNGALIYIRFFEHDRSFCQQENSDFCVEVVVNLHVQGQKKRKKTNGFVDNSRNLAN